MDIILSNTVAIELGLLLLKIFKRKKYDWLGKDGKSSILQWDCFHNHRRFGGLIVIFTVIIVNFLCGFFLINALWIPPKANLNIYRLLVSLTLGFLTGRELYDDIETWGTYTRIESPIGGKCRWLMIFMMFTETFIIIKFLKDAGNIIEDFTTPVYIWLPWLIVISSIIIFYLYLRFKSNITFKHPVEYYKIKND